MQQDARRWNFSGKYNPLGALCGEHDSFGGVRQPLLCCAYGCCRRFERWMLVCGAGLAFSKRDVRRGVGGASVVGARTNEAVVVVLLDDVGGPSGDAADGEDGGEEVDIDAEGGVGGGRVEVDVRVELLLLLDEEFDLA